MSILSDVQALYGSVHSTWAKSQAHVIAHFVLAGVVFGICGATIPDVAVAPIDPKQLSDNEWFKLAKDTGIVYVLFVAPIVLLAAYGAFLRAGGQMFVTIIMLMFPPSSHRNQYRLAIFPNRVMMSKTAPSSALPTLTSLHVTPSLVERLAGAWKGTLSARVIRSRVASRTFAVSGVRV
jgi:hypothetical protein